MIKDKYSDQYFYFIINLNRDLIVNILKNSLILNDNMKKNVI